ncbi:DUF3784 domain-containing protein [Lancefieldella parvula]
MLSSVILWSLTAILGIWSLVLLSGHGAISIAGYNTMTEDEKKTIDEKKLCFVMGISMSVCALTMLYMAVLSPNITITTTIVTSSIITIDMIVTIYIANTKCEK